jgi:photosystem II stability/assembly factor-like uncharacterized protein
MCAPIPSRGYFLGQSRLFSTSDGGATWTPVARTPFTGGTPTFVDARHAVAVVPKGGLYRTSDGGRRWTAVRLPGQPRDSGRQIVLPQVASFGARLVVPAERDVPSGNGPDAWRLVVYVSGDGGSTWEARPAPRWWRPFINGQDGQMFSAVSPTAWFVAGWRRLAVTRDAGRSWRLVRVADLHPGWTISAISFTTPRVGWAVFQSYRPPAAPYSPFSVLMRTTDGGVHWTAAGPRRPKPHQH